ncbi:MAG TPA: extracellular solute-binding protein, partial [Solirubrobacterales bacterium]|nr:extracellular solute-binding protein [Solirubrobacterales bacterium]
ALGACGASKGTTSEATAPSEAELSEPASGTVRIFAYDDAVTDRMLDPFRKANPELDLQVATYDSGEEAAAKLAGGFSADVVEVCLDEAQPLEERNLLRGIDTAGIEEWDKLTFRDNPAVEQNGRVIMVPLSAGPYGIIYNADKVPGGVDSYKEMFSDRFAGKISMDGSTAVSPLAVAAFTLGFDDPFAMSEAELEEAKQFLLENKDKVRSYATSDSDLVNLFKSGEVVVSNGGRGSTEEMQDEGLPVKWVEPKEGYWSWVCGLGITSKAKNIQAAYKLIDYYASPEAQAIFAGGGFVVTNPAAEPLIPAKFRKTADPKSITGAIPLTEPPNNEAYTKAWQEVSTG